MKAPHFISFAIFLFASACTTVRQDSPQINRFSHATLSFADQSLESLELLQNTTTELQIGEIANWDFDAVQGAKRKDFIIEGLRGIDDVLGNSQLARAIHTLRAYANALRLLSFVSNKSTISTGYGELQYALLSLNTSLSQLGGAPTGLDEASVGFVKTLAEKVTQTVIEQQRLEAIKGIVSDCDPYVAELCELMKVELEDILADALSNYETVFSYAVEAYKQDFDNNMEMNYTDKLERIQVLVEMGNRYKSIEQIQLRYPSMAEQVKQSHHLLKKALELEDLSSTELVDSIIELTQFTKDLRSYYDRIKPSES